MIIGLTGGIASGKSTVAQMFKDQNIPVVDADEIAREVVVQGEPAYEQIVHVFGKTIVSDDGALNRQRLGAIVFHDEEKRLLLNSIIHPAIRSKIAANVKRLKLQGHETIVLDIPLLFESNLTYLVDKVIVVYVGYNLQKQRLQKRNQFTDTEAVARIVAQMSLDEKILLADEVINNEGTLEETKQQLITILKKWNCR